MMNEEICNNCWDKATCNEADKEGYVDKDNPDFCMKNYKLNYLYTLAQIPVALRKRIALKIDKTEEGKWDLEIFKQLNEISLHTKEMVAEGKNVYIYSNGSGNGKTSWALRIVQNYFEEIWPDAVLECKALFISVPRLLQALKSSINSKTDLDYVNTIKANITTADIVIWDDIGSKDATVFEAENLYVLLEMRINTGKANIFTSNLNYNELHEALGDRLSSRIYNGSETFEIRGKDKRGLGK